jgi:hypothetical protein
MFTVWNFIDLLWCSWVPCLTVAALFNYRSVEGSSESEIWKGRHLKKQMCLISSDKHVISFPPLVGCGLLYSTPVGVICGSRKYPKVSEMGKLYDGKSRAVGEWLVLRRGSCAW